jgi:membrane-bound lytic murein transglycosylase B
MDRRAFLSLMLAGCAAQTGSTVAQPGVEPGMRVTVPLPPALTPSGSPSFDAWLTSFYPKAAAAGVPQEVLGRELKGLTPNDRVSALDSRQPEFSRPVGAYIQGAISADRIAQGRSRRASLAFLPAIEARYGVPRDIVIAIWAMESGFGAMQGDFDVVRSMATLAADGRRRGFAEDQLIAALKIIASGEFPRSRLIGSWAGAMGQTQFIPTTFLSTAVDGDGDGRRDIWGSSADALASAANLLGKAGWRKGESWAVEVNARPGFDFGLTEGPRDPPAAWADRGVTRADGSSWSSADSASAAELVAPSGAGGPLFLLFPNHFAIREYNNSIAYALAVGLLADRFAGSGPLIRPWPPETPLALTDRMAAQQALAKAGHDLGTPDGVVGIRTRAALRAWQKSRGLTADGYLSPEMVRRLRAELLQP